MYDVIVIGPLEEYRRVRRFNAAVTREPEFAPHVVRPRVGTKPASIERIRMMRPQRAGDADRYLEAANVELCRIDSRATRRRQSGTNADAHCVDTCSQRTHGAALRQG